MVDAVKLPSAERVDLAARLGQRLAGSPLIGGDRDGLEVGEIFHVDVLKSSGLAGRGPARRMGTRARQAPYLHVQVRRDRSAIFAAHVTKGDDDDWEIDNLFGAALAPKIAAAMQWIDRHLAGPGEARLLLVPESSVVAFQVRQPKRDRIVLVSATGDFPSLVPDEAYPVHAFLTTLFGDYGARAVRSSFERSKSSE